MNKQCYQLVMVSLTPILPASIPDWNPTTREKNSPVTNTRILFGGSKLEFPFTSNDIVI